jgi:hypothetical protein
MNSAAKVFFDCACGHTKRLHMPMQERVSTSLKVKTAYGQCSVIITVEGAKNYCSCRRFKAVA